MTLDALSFLCAQLPWKRRLRTWVDEAELVPADVDRLDQRQAEVPHLLEEKKQPQMSGFVNEQRKHNTNVAAFLTHLRQYYWLQETREKGQHAQVAHSCLCKTHQLGCEEGSDEPSARSVDVHTQVPSMLLVELDRHVVDLCKR